MHNFLRLNILAILLLGGVIKIGNVHAQSDETESVQFHKRMIASESYESVGVFDVDGDGHVDLVSGAFWYEGPDFTSRHYLGEIKRYGEYWDDFSTIPMDINGDGQIDYVTGSWFSENLRWRENLLDHSEWPEHVIDDETGPVETIRGWDVDNDSFLEIIPNNPGNPLKFYKLERDSDGKPEGTFIKVQVAENQGHGLGYGDVNEDGRGDFVLSNGWLESPPDIMNGIWTLHKEFELGAVSIPILVVDVNGNGKSDLIVGQGHGYGLDWYEQRTDNSRSRKWLKHPIDPDHSQFHTMEWTDLDGDDQHELVTGKRYRAHNGKDPGASDLVGLYYYKWDGGAFVKHTIAYGPLGEGKGTGIHFSVADLRRTGRNDIIVAGKDGLYVFFNEGVDAPDSNTRTRRIPDWCRSSGEMRRTRKRRGG